MRDIVGVWSDCVNETRAFLSNEGAATMGPTSARRKSRQICCDGRGRTAVCANPAHSFLRSCAKAALILVSVRVGHLWLVGAGEGLGDRLDVRSVPPRRTRTHRAMRQRRGGRSGLRDRSLGRQLPNRRRR